MRLKDLIKGHGGRMMKFKLDKITVALFVFLLIFGMFFVTATFEYNKEVMSEEQRLKDLLSVTKNNMESIITSRIISIQGLAAYAEMQGSFTQAEYDKFMEGIYVSTNQIVRNVTFLTDTIITHVYPYEENKSAIGSDLSLIEPQREVVQYVKEFKRTTLIAPVNLVQGGQGIVVRVPVVTNEKYFGQVAIVFDFQKTIEVIGIEGLSELNFIQLEEINPVTNKVAMIWSNYDLTFKEHIAEEVFLADTQLTLRLYPKEGIHGRTTLYYVILAFGLLMATFGYFSIWKLLDAKDKLLLDQEMMMEINEELYEANHELENTVGLLTASEAQIKHLAERDSLTDLLNRRRFIYDLERDIDQGNSGILFLLDLDNFKNVNDTLGHVYGDKVLKHVAQVLLKILVNKARVYRIGGDEFLIISKHETGVVDVDDLIANIYRALTEHNQVENINNHLTVSIGVVKFPQDGDNVEDILMRADLAMYSAKKAGKNRAMFFDEIMMSEFGERIDIEKKLRVAVENQDFKLLYQPVINTLSGEIVYFEALVRLKEMTLSPAVFIPIAEETGLILEIGRWVIRETMEQIKTWMAHGYEALPVAINLSPLQIDDDKIVDFFKEQLELHGLESHMIEVEITENMLIDSGEEKIKNLEKIRNLGITIALDDFGTGYSSINYLSFMPVDKIKLDKSLKDKFIHQDNTKVMEGIISIAHGLGLTVVTEGVEEQVEYMKLRELKCDMLQGYLFSKPVSGQEIEKLFETKAFWK